MCLAGWPLGSLYFYKASLYYPSSNLSLDESHQATSLVTNLDGQLMLTLGQLTSGIADDSGLGGAMDNVEKDDYCPTEEDQEDYEPIRL